MPACSSRCLTVPCACTYVCLQGKALQAVIVPETLTNKHICLPLFSLVLSITRLLYMYHHCWPAAQRPSPIYSLSSQHKAHWISPLIPIRHLVLPLSLLAQQHTHTHTHSPLLPSPNSVMQITGFVVCCQCVANTGIAGVCSVDAVQQVLCWGDSVLSVLGCTCLGLACVCARWLW